MVLKQYAKETLVLPLRFYLNLIKLKRVPAKRFCGTTRDYLQWRMIFWSYCMIFWTSFYQGVTMVYVLEFIIYSSYMELLLSIDYTSNIYHELNSCQIWWSRSVKILRRSIMQFKTVTLLFSFRLLSLLLLFSITSILLPRWDMRYLYLYLWLW